MIQFHRQFEVSAMELVLFDLDGTLIDSRLDLAQSVNATLRRFGRPELPVDRIVGYVGDGAAMLVRRALGGVEKEAFLAEALDYFLTEYGLHKLDQTRPYEGVLEMLATAQCSAGRRRFLAVLSNKPVHLSKAIIDGLGMQQLFAAVYGGDSFKTKKPDRLGANEIMGEAGVAAPHALLVGDSKNDVLTGRNAGMRTCGVSYGFDPQSLIEVRPDVIVDTATELKELFG